MVTACATVYPSARLGRGSCEATPEALAQVTYQPQPDRPTLIEIGCAGCDEVYVAAEYAWLDRHYHGYTVREHSTQVPTIWEQGPAPDFSCFSITTAAQEMKKVCFFKSDWCRKQDAESDDSA